MSGASTGSPGTPHNISRALTKASRSNFYYAFLVLPTAKRQALFAVYAYMRRCDDIADDFKVQAYERRQRLEAWLGKLSANEREVIEMRFGLNNDEPQTLNGIGRKYGITRERVRQIENKAINKLKYLSRREHVTADVIF